MAAAKKTPAKAGAKKRPARKAPAKKSSAKKAAAKKTPAKATTKSPAKKSSATKTAAKKTPSRKAARTTAPATKRAAKQTAAKGSAKKATAKRATAKATTTRTTTKTTTKTTSTKATSKQATTKVTSKKAAPAKAGATKSQEKSTALSTPDVEEATHELPKPRFNKDGFGYTKDFDLTFIKQQHDALQEERVRLTGQAKRLEDEAHQLVEEAEMGDVQFDDEGGEGDTMVVERERDLALSAQAREAVAEIDAAIERIFAGTYGYSTVSGRLVPRERLEAIPWADVLVEEKVGGIGRR